MAATERPSGRLAGVSAMFDGGQLTLARQLAGLKKIQLAERIEMTPASVSAWENGTKKPNGSTIARLSIALAVEPQFFSIASSTALAPAPPHFRSLRSTSQLALDQAFAYGRLAGDIAALLEKSVEFPPRDLPAYPLSPTEISVDGPEVAARLARERFGLPVGPVQHLVRLAEKAGVLVVFSPPQTASIDAYSLESGGRPIIVLNPDKDDYYRQRFDVAHELGHLIMHSDAEPGGRIAEEQAHRFASEFLMPAAEIEPHVPRSTTNKGWATLRQLKEHWGVSMQALLYRARALGVMSDVTYRNAMIRVSSLGWRRAEPGNVVALEMPSLIPRAVEVLNEAGIPPDDIVRGPGLPLPIFRMVASRTPRPSLGNNPGPKASSATAGVVSVLFPEE